MAFLLTQNGTVNYAIQAQQQAISGQYTNICLTGLVSCSVNDYLQIVCDDMSAAGHVLSFPNAGNTFTAVLIG